MVFITTHLVSTFTSRDPLHGKENPFPVLYECRTLLKTKLRQLGKKQGKKQGLHMLHPYLSLLTDNTPCLSHNNSVFGQDGARPRSFLTKYRL